MHGLRFFVYKFRLLSCQNNSLFKICRKYSGKKLSRKKESGTVKALEHFDDLYKGIFKTQWHSIRLGLLSKSKHVVLLNNFGDIAETEEFLKCQGALDIRAFTEKSAESALVDDNEQEADLLLENDETVDMNEDIEAEEIVKASYPEGCDNKIETFFKDYKLEPEDYVEDAQLERIGVVDANMSMSEALAQSKIDQSRLIDPSMGLDSLQDFIPVSKMRRQDEYIEETDYFRFYTVNSDFPVNTEKEEELPFPKYLKVYSFPRCDVTSFPPPKMCANGVFNYYPMDGASILPVLALGLQSGDIVLDMCAAPGGKSLTILQTMLPSHLVCNDKSPSRCKRLNNVLKQYIYDYPDQWRNYVSVTTQEGEAYSSNHKFNKILVDVPCTTDKISATVDENNIFKGQRIKERLKLPEYQTGLLESALKLVQPGGTVVYSTCTLSPIQNDGVVNLALQKVWREHNIEFTVRDLSPALQRHGSFYRFASSNTLKYGSLVLPFVPINFGPMYFCKLVRHE